MKVIRLKAKCLFSVRNLSKTGTIQVDYMDFVSTKNDKSIKEKAAWTSSSQSQDR